MWEEILSLAMNHGLMSALFIGLMIYVLKDCSRREKKNTEIIEKLAEKFKVLEDIQRDITDLKNEIRNKKN